MRSIAEIDEDIRKLKEERNSVLESHRTEKLATLKGKYDGKWVCKYDTTPMKIADLSYKIPSNKTLYHIVEVTGHNPSFGEITCRVDTKIRIADKLDDQVKEVGVSVVCEREQSFSDTDLNRGFVEVIDHDTLVRYIEEFKQLLNFELDLINTLVEKK